METEAETPDAPDETTEPAPAEPSTGDDGGTGDESGDGGEQTGDATAS
jgi:hypothetical protein